MSDRVALLLDGGFVRKKLVERPGYFPAVTDIVTITTALMTQPRLQETCLFRVYYYDAPPFEGTATNPIDGSILNFSSPRPPRRAPAPSAP